MRNNAVDPTGPVLRVPAPTRLVEAMRLPKSSAAFGVDWETGNVVPSSLYASAAAIQPDTLWPPVWVGVTLAESWNSSCHDLKTTGHARGSSWSCRSDSAGADNSQ